MSPKIRNACRRIAATKGDRAKRAKLWQAARILREFTCDELAAVCDLENVQSVRTFVGQLSKVGFLLPVTTAKPRRYRLVRNTGPLVPHFVRYRTVIYDPNTDQEHPYVQ